VKLTIISGFFLPIPPLAGGATERSWHGLSIHLAKMGNEVTVISRTWPGLPDASDDDGVRHIRVAGFSHTRRLALNLLLDLFWGIRVARRIPRSDFIICNTVTLPAWLGFVRPSLGRVAVFIGRTPKGQTRLYGRVARIYVTGSSVLRELTPPGLARRARAVGCPIEWASFAAQPRPARGQVTVGYVGRLHPEKGIELLVRAALLLAKDTDLPPWRLVLTGPQSVPQGGGGEEWLGRMKALAAPLGNVEWRGPEFEQDRLAAAYASMDVFCYPSVAEKGETFGVAVAEAMAARCAAVVSGLDCFGDLVRDGETGLVFDHRSPEAAGALAGAISRLLCDEALRSRLAARGQEHARHFDYPAVASKIMGDLAVLAGEISRNPS
jgi:glycosyltransferase involved in cell wall biosynthesis